VTTEDRGVLAVSVRIWTACGPLERVRTLYHQQQKSRAVLNLVTVNGMPSGGRCQLKSRPSNVVFRIPHYSLQNRRHCPIKPYAFPRARVRSVRSGTSTAVLPLNALLLQYYVEETGPRLAIRLPRHNPFIKYILPVAYCDDLLMHAVLALGGAHLMFQRGIGRAIEQATWTHYEISLRKMSHALKSESWQESCYTLRLLLTSMLLCHFEVRLTECHELP
jgi:Fungal specific transcription factor domain